MAHQDLTTDRPDLATLILEARRTLRTSYEQAVGQHNPAKAHRCAKEALVFAELLIDNLTEWAVDDVIGSRANNPKTVTTKRKLKAKTDDRALDRVRIADAIVIGGIVPQIYRQELQLALKALNLGEARPLLRPSPTGRWRDPFSLSECWQLAILHVFYRWGSGGTKKAAQEIVASALGVAPSTLRTWENTALPEINENAQALWKIARRAGTQVQNFEMNPGDGHLDKAALVMHRYLLSNPLELLTRRYKSAAGFGAD